VRERGPIITQNYLSRGPAEERRQEFEILFGGENKLPFKSPQSLDGDRSITCGHFFGVAREEIESQSYAIKVHFQGGEASEVLGQTKRDREEYEELKRAGFGPFLPTTFFLVGHGLENKPTQINIQSWIDGEPLGERSLSEMMKDFSLIWNLKNFIYQILKHFFNTGKLIDYYGFGIRRDAPPRVRFSLKRFSVFASRNLIWNREGLFLVDPTSHQVGLNIKDKGKRFLLLGLSLLALCRDYFTSLFTIKKRLNFLNDEEGKVRFGENIKKVISKLEELRERGLDYRVVGGLAAAAILERDFPPFRSNGSKRDLDVLVLNPGSFEKDLEELEEWANERALHLISFPFLSLHRVESGRKSRFQTYFSPGEKNNLLFSFGNHSLPVPPSAMEVELLEFEGVRFPSFPRWFHYFLYLTRNFGYIRGKDKVKVRALKKIAFSTQEGRDFDPLANRFLKTVPISKRIINAIRLKFFWLLGH